MEEMQAQRKNVLEQGKNSTCNFPKNCNDCENKTLQHNRNLNVRGIHPGNVATKSLTSISSLGMIDFHPRNISKLVSKTQPHPRNRFFTNRTP